MPSEFWAAIIGALVGGSVSLLLQLLQQSHERALRTIERQDQQRMLAYSLTYKLMTISSMFTRVSHHFEKTFSSAPNELEPWQFLEAFATAHRHVSFSADEMTMLLKVSAESFNDIAALDEVHNAFADTLMAYANRKEKLYHMLPPSVMEGRKGTIIATHEQLMAARPIMIEANGMAHDMRRFAKRDAGRTLNAINALIPKFNRKLDMKLSFEERSPSEWLDADERVEGERG